MKVFGIANLQGTVCEMKFSLTYVLHLNQHKGHVG